MISSYICLFYVKEEFAWGTAFARVAWDGFDYIYATYAMEFNLPEVNL
jgi:hypothetical protein